MLFINYYDLSKTLLWFKRLNLMFQNYEEILHGTKLDSLKNKKKKFNFIKEIPEGLTWTDVDCHIKKALFDSVD